MQRYCGTKAGCMRSDTVAATTAAFLLLLAGILLAQMTVACKEDINRDGKVGFSDVLALHLLGRSDPTEPLTDYDGDEKWSLADAAQLDRNIHTGSLTAVETEATVVRAGDYFAYHLLNLNDTLRFQLAAGRVVQIKVINKGVDVYNDFGYKQWTLWAEFEVDGHPLRLVYSPFRMKAMYEPKVVNGVRMGLDGVKGLAAATGVGGASSEAEPPKDVRFWVQDATLPLLPECHIWFTLPQDRVIPGWPKTDDYRIRQDRDVHPAQEDLNKTYKNDNDTSIPTYKTGWMGAWPYDGPSFHNGLDIQLEVGTDLFTVIDSCTQGRMESSWHGITYTHNRGNGDRWTFTNLHCESPAAEQGASLMSGSLTAISGTYRAGIAHAHTTTSYRPTGGSTMRVNPWPVMWQGIENRKEKDGFIRARIAPVGPAQIGEAITFDGAGSSAEKGFPTLTYKWFFDDSTTATQATVKKSFATAGMHQAILVVDDGRLKDVAEVFFTVGDDSTEDAPRITLEIVAKAAYGNPQLPNVGAGVTYTVKAQAQNGHTLRYEWDFGDGAASGQTVIHKALSAGRHIIVATVTDVVNGRRRMDWYMLDTYEWPSKSAQ